MANLFDYLLWRNDVPLSLDPFGEVDNLLLSELAYTDFGSIVPEDGGEIPLADACAAFFASHDRDAILESTAYTAKAPLLMETMVTGARFGGMRLCRYINRVDREKDAQISAVACLLDDGTAFVAFRGTDGSVVGWKEDFELSYLSGTAGQKAAAQYLADTAARIPRPLRVGGHSKGGNFAVYACIFAPDTVKDRILNVYTNDGPGFRPDITALPEYQALLPKIVSIVPESSIIGRLLRSGTAPIVVKSSAQGIVQHDGFSWQILKNRFEPSSPSPLSDFMETTVRAWSDELDDAQWKVIVDLIFSMLEATGFDTLSSINEQKRRSIEAMFSALRQLPKKEQAEGLAILGHLIVSSSHSAAQFLQSRQEKQNPQ